MDRGLKSCQALRDGDGAAGWCRDGVSSVPLETGACETAETSAGLKRGDDRREIGRLQAGAPNQRPVDVLNGKNL